MPPERRTIRMDLNRVEGDMEVRLELDGHTVTDAWCVGTMFRGFEQILVGRDPGDALVIAPRICGICTHLAALRRGVRAGDGLRRRIAPNGTRIRNLCLMAESVMSDARHTFLMFAPDFCNPAYRDHPLYDRVMELFEPPFKGRLAAETVESTKRVLAIVIAFGGQWPHSTYMMPGGVTCPLDEARLDECAAAIDAYAEWYERSVLGCTCDEWLALESADDFEAWLEAHRDSAVGVFTRFGRSIGLNGLGEGHAAPAERRLLLRPGALAAAVPRAPVPAARRLLRRRARRDRAVPPRVGRRAHALREARRPGRAPASVGQRDDPGRLRRRGLQLRQGDALRRPRGPARPAGRPLCSPATR